MSWIADAQRRSGRVIGGDAERAWDAGREIAGESFDPVEAPFDSDRRPDQAVVSTAAARLPAAGQLTALVERLFSPAPAGAGLRQILFCSPEPRESTGIVRPAAAYLMAERRIGSAAVVELRESSERIALRTGVQLIAMNATSARHRAVELTACFDFVLFDACGTAIDADVLMLARSVDGAVLVIDEQTTRRDAARTLLDALRDAGATVLGAVLSNRAYPIPSGIYQRL